MIGFDSTEYYIYIYIYIYKTTDIRGLGMCSVGIHNECYNVNTYSEYSIESTYCIQFIQLSQ